MINITQIILWEVAVIILVFSLIFIYKKYFSAKGKLNTEIKGTRLKLKELYEQYQKEFLEINKKIDSYLEKLE